MFVQIYATLDEKIRLEEKFPHTDVILDIFPYTGDIHSVTPEEQSTKESGISIFSEEIDGEVQNTFVDCLLKYIDGRNSAAAALMRLSAWWKKQEGTRIS